MDPSRPQCRRQGGRRGSEKAIGHRAGTSGVQYLMTREAPKRRAATEERGFNSRPSLLHLGSRDPKHRTVRLTAGGTARRSDCMAGKPGNQLNRGHLGMTQGADQFPAIGAAQTKRSRKGGREKKSGGEL